MRRRLVESARARLAAGHDSWDYRVQSLSIRRQRLGRRVRRVRTRLASAGADLRRRRFVAAAAVLLVAVLVGVVLLVVAQPDSGPDGDPPGRTAAPGPAPTAEWTAGTGPGLSVAGIDLDVVARSSGDLAAVERVIAPEPIARLTLAVPPLLPDSDGPAARLADLRIVADGERLPASVTEELERGGEAVLTEPATRIELRYLVVGADARSEQALPGRVSLSLRPVASAAVEPSPAVVTLRGVVVHTMVCLEVPPERQLCGVDDHGTWHTTELSTTSSSVLALVDLPRPTARSDPNGNRA